MNTSAVSELQKITDAMKCTKDRRMVERYQAVKFFLEGHSLSRIAQIIGRNRTTIRSYIRSYAAKGAAGLDRNYSPGRPSLLTAAQRQQVAKMVSQQTPASAGFPGKICWTSALVASWIQHQFAVKYTNRGVLDLLHRLNFVYSHSTYVSQARSQQPIPLPKQVHSLKIRE